MNFMGYAYISQYKIETGYEGELIEQLYLSLLTSTSSSKNNIKAQME